MHLLKHRRVSGMIRISHAVERWNDVSELRSCSKSWVANTCMIITELFNSILRPLVSRNELSTKRSILLLVSTAFSHSQLPDWHLYAKSAEEHRPRSICKFK